MKSFLKKKVWDWSFKILTPVDYELCMVFHAENKLFLNIFQKAKSKLESKNINGDPELIDKFDLDAKFFNLIKTYLKKPFRLTSNDVLKQQGFLFLDYHVVNGWFERDKNRNWNIHLVLKGTYSDKR